MTRRPATTPRPGRVLLGLTTLLLVALAVTTPLRAATAKDLYTAALTHERELRAPADESPTLAQLRGAIAAYKAIVRQYPRSDYSDNALWQSAGLAIQAFDLYREPADRDAGVEFLRALEREYASSSLVPRVADRLEQLTRLEKPVQIRAINRERLADIVRVTITLDDEVRYNVVRLDDPPRLFFDFSTTYAAPPLHNATLAFDDGDLVSEIRLGRHPGQTTRVVLDIADVDSYNVYSLYNPYRLVVDTVPTASRQARREPSEAPAIVAPAPDGALDVLLVAEGWDVQWLDPIPPILEQGAVNLVDIQRVVSSYQRVTDPVLRAASSRDPSPPSATSGSAMPEDADELAWPQVHNVLYPNLGSPPSLGTGAERPPADTTSPGFVTPLRRREAVVPATPVFSESVPKVLPFPRVERTTQVVHEALVSAEPAVADVVPVSFGPSEGRPGTKTALANTDGDFSLGRQLGLSLSRIVIDPGHGGYDPGAQTGGLTESELVLDVAQRLEARLTTQAGIEVFLTRRGNDYVPLRARTELANRVGADLFLSIHANAAGDRSARGVETYFLDLASDPSAQAVAARENATFREGMHDLPQLVRSITMHNKRDESRDFAGMVQRNLVGAVRELHPDAQDLGVKQAPFVVLIGANMPSVLSEISFLSNKEDASFLATDAYRDQIADALFRSILEYQQTLKPSPILAAGNND